MTEPRTPATPDVDDLRAVLDDPLLLDGRDDTAALVPALPAAAFVRMARRLYDEGRLDLLLPKASADQLVSVLDLDAWQGDHMDVARARRWLVAIGESWAAAEKPRIVELADRIAGRFVAALLLVAAATGAWWWWFDPSQALWVFVAVLVVSCPCALSLATPAALTVDPDDNRAWVRENKPRGLVDKRMGVREAVEQYVHDGNYVAVGGFGHPDTDGLDLRGHSPAAAKFDHRRKDRGA